MKKIFSILLLALLCLLPITAQANLAQLKALYPTADAVYLRQEKSFTLNDNGSIDYHYSHQLVYLTPYAFNSLYGESFILYNPEFQTLKINVSETLTPDGRKVASPANAYNEVLPSNAANSPAYNHLKEMVVSHTALEMGAIVTLDYIIHCKPNFSNNLIGNELLNSTAPVKYLRYEVNLPMSKKLNLGSFNVPSQAVVQARGAMQNYSWEFRNLPGFMNESLFSPISRPRIVFSTQPLNVDFIRINESVTGKLNPDLEKWSNDKLVGKVSDIERLFALQKAVVNEINSYGVTFDQAAYRYRNANEVFLSNGGTEVEKTVLLANLLKSNGMFAEVVGIIPAWMQNDDKAENLLMISHFYVRTSLGNTTMYLSAVELNSADPTKNFDGVIVVDQYGPHFSNSGADVIQVKGKLSIGSDNKLKGHLKGLFENGTAPEYAIQRNEASLANLFFFGVKKQTFKRVSPTKIVANFELNQFLGAKINGGYQGISLPEVNLGLIKFKTAIVPISRKTVLHFPTLMNEFYSYSIHLKNGGELLTPNVNILQKTDFAEMQISIRQKKKGGAISVVRSFKLLKQDFNPSEYAEISTMLAVWFDKKYQVLLLK